MNQKNKGAKHAVFQRCDWNPYTFMIILITLPETNIFAPENGWLEDDFPFGKLPFQG